MAPTHFSSEFKPKNFDKLKESWDRNAHLAKPSLLHENAKVLPALQALGYSDVSFGAPIEGKNGSNFVADYYSPEKNTLFLVLSSDNLCYDRETPNADFRLHERVANALPQKPKICVINLFTLSGIADKAEKVKFLTEKCGVPLAAEKVNLEVAGL